MRIKNTIQIYLIVLFFLLIAYMFSHFSIPSYFNLVSAFEKVRTVDNYKHFVASDSFKTTQIGLYFSGFTTFATFFGAIGSVVTVILTVSLILYQYFQYRDQRMIGKSFSEKDQVTRMNQNIVVAIDKCKYVRENMKIDNVGNCIEVIDEVKYNGEYAIEKAMLDAKKFFIQIKTNPNIIHEEFEQWFRISREFSPVIGYMWLQISGWRHYEKESKEFLRDQLFFISNKTVLDFMYMLIEETNKIPRKCAINASQAEQIGEIRKYSIQYLKERKEIFSEVNNWSPLSEYNDPRNNENKPKS